MCHELYDDDDLERFRAKIEGYTYEQPKICSHERFDISHHRKFGWLKWCLDCKKDIFGSWGKHDNGRDLFCYKMHQIPSSIREKAQNQDHIKHMIEINH